MKRAWVVLSALIILPGSTCDSDSTGPDSGRRDLLTQGIWEVAQDTEAGQPGVQLEFHSDGTARVRETSSSPWYPETLTWTLNEDESELYLTGTDQASSKDDMQILELTASIFRGRIFYSSDQSEIGKVMKLLQTQ